MPIGLPGEDGFLRAMLLTSNFTAPEDVTRLVFVDGARHVFESERSIRGVFRHNVRLAIGTAVNIFLFHHFRLRSRTSSGLAVYIQERNAADPKWVNTLISEQIEINRYFIVPTSFLWRRLNLLAELPKTAEQLRKAPIFLLGFYIRCCCLSASQSFDAKGYWRRILVSPPAKTGLDPESITATGSNNEGLPRHT